MDSAIVQRLSEASSRYTQSLWRRFVGAEQASPEQAEFFSSLRPLMSQHIGNLPSLPSNLGEIMSKTDSDELADILFSPGATDGIFINIHEEMLNGWIHSHGFFEIVYVAQGDVIDWIDGVEVPLATNELCIHNPRARHQILKMDEGSDLLINVL